MAGSGSLDSAEYIWSAGTCALRRTSHTAGAAYPADVETLKELGAIRVQGVGRPSAVEVTPHGHALYAEWQASAEDAASVVIDVERRLIESGGFRRRHPRVYAKWRQAADLLWSEDSSDHATSIGHLCREAHQLLISSLLASVGHDPEERDPQRTKSRLRELLASNVRSDTIRAVVESAEAYFSAVADLAQRQEHGAQREREQLTWADSRRLVLHTLVILSELDRLVGAGD